MTRVRLLIAISTLVLSACRKDSAAGDIVRATRVIDDTVIMELRGIREQPSVEVVSELVIGDPMATEEAYQFSSIGALAVDRRGRVFVYDDDSRQLRVFDATGQHIRNIGRQGSGPGEYRHVGGMAVAPDGRLVVSDPFNGRIVIFSEDGAPVAHMSKNFGSVVQALSAIWVDTAGNLILLLDPFAPGATLADSSRPVFERLSSDGDLRDTLRAPGRLFAHCTVRPEPRFRSGFLQDIREPYVLKPRWGLTSAGDVIAGCPESYRFEVLRSDGDVLRFEVADWTPVQVSKEELENHRERWSRSMRLSGLAPDFSWDDAQLVPRKPAYDFFLADPGGRIWVWVPQPSVEVPIRGRVGPGARDTKWIDPPAPMFDVFESAAGWVARVRIPSNISFEANPRVVPPVVRGDTLWAVTRDTTGVESITRFRLTFADENP